MKRMLAFLLIIILAISIVLTGCSSSDSKLSFSSYYKNAKAFDEFAPLLQDFYTFVKSAYDACSNEDPTTFTYDQTAFLDLHTKVTDIMLDAVNDIDTSEMKDPEFDVSPYHATSDAKNIYWDLYATIANLVREIEAGRTPDDWYTQIGDVLEQTRVAYAEDK